MVPLVEPMGALQQLMLNEGLLSKASLANIATLDIDDTLKLAVKLLVTMHEVEEKAQTPLSQAYSKSYILVPKSIIAAILIAAIVLGAVFSGGQVMDGIVAGFYCFGVGSLLIMLGSLCAAKKIQAETATSYTEIRDITQLIPEHQQQFAQFVTATGIALNHNPIAEVLSNWIKENVQPLVASADAPISIVVSPHEEIDATLGVQETPTINTVGFLSP
jgi:hypothetical protein